MAICEIMTVRFDQIYNIKLIISKEDDLPKRRRKTPF